MVDVENRKLKIAFTGNLPFSSYFREKENADILSSEVKSFPNESQWTIINLESPITDKGETEKERLFHKCDREAAFFIRDNFNNTIVSFANNHMMDFGERYAGYYGKPEQGRNSAVGAGRNLK